MIMMGMQATRYDRLAGRTKGTVRNPIANCAARDRNPFGRMEEPVLGVAARLSTKFPIKPPNASRSTHNGHSILFASTMRFMTKRRPTPVYASGATKALLVNQVFQSLLLGRNGFGGDKSSPRRRSRWTTNRRSIPGIARRKHTISGRNAISRIGGAANENASGMYSSGRRNEFVEWAR